MAAAPTNNNNQVEDSEDDLRKLDSWLIQIESGRKPPVAKFRASVLSGTPPFQVGKALNLTFRTSQSDGWLVNALLSSHGLTEVSATNNDFNLLWTGSHPRPHTFSSLRSYQRVNHFPRSYELTRKDRLYKNVARLQHCHGSKHFDFLPPSFIMPNEYRDFWSAHHRLHGPWIVKPVASSRGRGIYLVSKPEEVPMEEPVLVSKYIANPLLVDGHKCDLRLYVAVTSYDPLVIYLYRHGIVRFAAVKYTADQSSLDNPCIHLCNYSINKYHADFVVSEDPSVEDVGHKRSLTGFLKYLRSQGKDVNRLMRRIEDVCIKAIMAATPPVVAACKMFVPNRNNCFELYGFDILVDSDLKPWLLEVNLSPSLGCDSPLDLRVKSAMLSDLLTLVGIPAVDPATTQTTPGSSVAAQRQGRAKTAPTSTERNQYRRAQSADTGPRSRLQQTRTVKLTSSASTITAEESRILTQLRDDYERRGDFNRIFPTEDSWPIYGDFIETLCSSPALASPGVSFNRMVHDRLFPLISNNRTNSTTVASVAAAAVAAASTNGSCDSTANLATLTSAAKLPPRIPKKLLRPANRSLNQPTGTSVRFNSLNWAHPNWRSLNEESEGESSTSFYEDAVLQPLTIDNRRPGMIKGIKKAPTVEDSPTRIKKEIHEQLANQYILSQEQSRRGFSRYLRFVQQRLPGLENSTDCVNQLDLIERFLQRLGSAGRLRSASPSPKSQMKKLTGSDRVASLASKLGEFLDRYEQSSSHHHGDCEGDLKELKVMPSPIFDDFLEFASEKEIEEVLCQHSKNAPCSHFLSGRCYPRSNRSTSDAVRNANLGLLREACCLTSSSSSGNSTTLGSRVNSSRVNSQKTKEEKVDLSGRNVVVSFDLRCANNRRQQLTPANNVLRPHSRASILKREKSM
ncbi:tubulin polyglutamylase TTLL5-like [Daphnia pulex]|uniref:tubulin polyglutamylase TTLL5-like n=1 Tax=Daphnia pulex TaxID=6669 RepID=UPI001EDCE0B7|nr:tubulin polyglutamylase TTLL5-like [Daphnia pulex]